MKTKLFTKTLLASAMSLSLGTAIAAPYEIIDLGKVEGGSNSFAYGINDSGEIVGYGNGPLQDDSTTQRTFGRHALNFSNNQLIDLGTLENGNSSIALKINNNGVAVGFSDQERTVTDSDGNETRVVESFAVKFDGGTIAKFVNLDGYVNSQAFDINDQSIAVGIGFVDIDPDDGVSPVERGFVYNSSNDTLISQVNALSESNNRRSYPLAINNNGVVVGWAEKESGNLVQVLGFSLDVNNPETLTELPTLGTNVTMARDVNNNGLIVGYAYTSTTSSRSTSFIYDPASQSELQRIPFFAEGFDDSIANAVNDQGQVVGQALVSPPSTGVRAGYLFENDELKNLNNLIPCNSGWNIDNAIDINNNGEIVGYGVKDVQVDGRTIKEIRAFRLNPTGGAIETCSDDSNQNQNSGGGGWSIPGLLLLSLYYIRRKYH